MKKLMAFVLALACVLALCSCGRNSQKAVADNIIAEYGSHKITKGTIDYYRNMQSLGYGANKNTATSDIEIANQLIMNIILEEEAVRLGLAATDAEIEEMFKSVLQAYEIPEGKKLIDDYCNGAGITVQEYFDLVLEQLPETITRQKLRDEFGKIYCKEQGIEFTKVNQPTAMKEYVEQRINELFESRKSSIVYYTVE